ncbi:MAG: toprim domain-containing protein [Oscillospiraceae bacterium]|nr:toprim domain-containing protein [Oscillospiraceae bacterium]
MAKNTEIKIYNDDTISSLKGADRVRKRPAVMFGSDGLEGCQHAFFEILTNSVDEAKEGYGSSIIVTSYSDLSIKVEDFARGLPLDWNEKEQKYNWELVYCELYAGGKYNNEEGGIYEFSLGLNGLGACATQYSSEFFEVTSVYNKTKHQISFKKGEAVTQLAKEPAATNKTGTTQYWKPDLEVFTDIAIPYEYYADVMKKQSIVNAGIKFILNFQNRETGEFIKTEYLYKNGILDYIEELAGENFLTKPVLWNGERTGRDREDKPEYKVKMQISLCFSNTLANIEYYHNSSYLEHGGSPEKALKSAAVFAVDRYLKSSGKYTKNESKIIFADIEDCLVCVTNCFSTQTSYANQTKKAINNVFVTEAMTDFLKHNFEVYFAENPNDAEKIAAQVLINKRSRESAESARLNLKKKLSSGMEMGNRVEKFVNCRSRDASLRELYIVEGDSALTSCKLARNAEFQAIIPVRGKTFNCLKSTYDRIFKNEIIMDLLRVIGCGVEIRTKSHKDLTDFDIDMLKWNKIIICTDADEDGYHIRTLIMTMFYRLLPTLIKLKKVYIAESPLFEITCRDNIQFAYNEKEKNEIVSKLKDKKYTIQRSKGLGENEPDMMSFTTMAPETRRLICVNRDEEHMTEIMFDTLLGDDLQGRKKFIAENSHRYAESADI